MVKVSLLFLSVLTLFCFMIPGFVLRKTKLASEHFAKVLSVFTLYVAQVAMLIHGFLTPFDKTVFRGFLSVLLFALAEHLIFFFLARRCFRKAPDTMRRVLQFGVIFSNAGYMGIPVIEDVFGPEFKIYATAYVVSFNIFAFTLGRLIYTEDKKYISLKEAIINPAVIPIMIGLVFYLTGIGGWIYETAQQTTAMGKGVGVIYKVFTVFNSMVAPASMVVIGARLADINFKGIFRDKYMYPFIGIRLFAFPCLVWLLTFGLYKLCIIDYTVMAVLTILSSTPAAAVTTMFAELYNGDSPYAGKLVALSTILSVGTMPIVALLLSIT